MITLEKAARPDRRGRGGGAPPGPRAGVRRRRRRRPPRRAAPDGRRALDRARGRDRQGLDGRRLPRAERRAGREDEGAARVLRLDQRGHRRPLHAADRRAADHRRRRRRDRRDGRAAAGPASRTRTSCGRRSGTVVSAGVRSRTSRSAPRREQPRLDQVALPGPQRPCRARARTDTRPVRTCVSVPLQRSDTVQLAFAPLTTPAPATVRNRPLAVTESWRTRPFGGGRRAQARLWPGRCDEHEIGRDRREAARSRLADPEDPGAQAGRCRARRGRRTRP